MRREYSDNFSDALVAEVLEGIRFAKSSVEDIKDDLINTIGEDQWKWAKQLVRHMEQVQQVNFDDVRNNRFYVRDDYMAENVTWYFDLLGQDKKLVLWAHNGHIADDDQIYAPFGGSQGDYLEKEYGQDYQIIGFSFGKGSFLASADAQSAVITLSIETDPIEDSYNSLLHRTNNEQYILPLDTNETELDDWLDGLHKFLGIGLLYNGVPSDFYRSIRLGQHFDYLIHFDTVESSVLLN